MPDSTHLELFVPKGRQIIRITGIVQGGIGWFKCPRFEIYTIQAFGFCSRLPGMEQVHWGHCPVSLECVILSSIQKGHRRKSGCSIALASFSYVFPSPVRIVFLQTHVYILLFPRTVSESNREHVVRSDRIAAMILFLSSGCREVDRIPGERSRRSSRLSLTLPSCEQPASSFFVMDEWFLLCGQCSLGQHAILKVLHSLVFLFPFCVVCLCVRAHVRVCGGGDYSRVCSWTQRLGVAVWSSSTCHSSTLFFEAESQSNSELGDAIS